MLEINRDRIFQNRSSAAADGKDAELGRRGLDVPAGNAQTGDTAEDTADDTGGPGAGAEPTPPQEELAVADEFTSLQELGFARSLLRSAEIPSYTDSDLPDGDPGGLRLFVPAAFLEQAQAVLDAPLTDEELAAQAEAAGPEEVIEEAEVEAAKESGEEPDKAEDITL